MLVWSCPLGNRVRAPRRGVTTGGMSQSHRWLASRVARPARDLAASAAFYRDLLGLREQGGFRNHDGYDGVFFALPGGGELELTSGPAEPTPGTEEDLLVLYLGTADEVSAVAGALRSAGAAGVTSPNPYWNRWGRTFLDPDGHRVVIAAADPGTVGSVRPAAPGPPGGSGRRWRIRDRWGAASGPPRGLGRRR